MKLLLLLSLLITSLNRSTETTNRVLVIEKITNAYSVEFSTSTPNLSPSLQDSMIFLAISGKKKEAYPAKVECGKNDLVTGVLGGLIGAGITLSICAIDRRNRGYRSNNAFHHTPSPSRQPENMSGDTDYCMQESIKLLKGLAIGKQRAGDLMKSLIASLNEEMQKIENIQYDLIANNLELLGKHQEYMLCVSQQVVNSNDTYENKLAQLKKTVDCRLSFLEKIKKNTAQIQQNFLQLKDEVVTHYAVLIKKYLHSYQARQKKQVELVYHQVGRGIELGKKMVELRLQSLDNVCEAGLLFPFVVDLPNGTE